MNGFLGWGGELRVAMEVTAEGHRLAFRSNWNSLNLTYSDSWTILWIDSENYPTGHFKWVDHEAGKWKLKPLIEVHKTQ